jgi:Flp pilus assembly protein TadG
MHIWHSLDCRYRALTTQALQSASLFPFQCPQRYPHSPFFVVRIYALLKREDVTEPNLINSVNPMFAFMSRLRREFERFAHARGGNVAMTFGLAMLPVIASVGAAIDYSHANSVKAAMQSALDASALMLSRDAATLSNADLQAKAKSYFLATFTRPEATNITISATYSGTGGSQVVVTGSSKVPTSLMAIMGYNSITVNGMSTAKWGTSRLRVALALDNTGSMADDGKLSALKTATKNMLVQLQTAATTNGDVYVSIIPFSKDVNVGDDNDNASWIDWTDWSSDNGSCSKDTRNREYSSKSSCNSAGGNWTVASKSSWNGCVTDRGGSSAPDSNDYDQKVTAPGSTAASKFPADQPDSCVAEMMGLSYSWSSMTSLVNSMVAVGATNQPIGLVWAWQSLVGGGPMTAPVKDSNYTYNEVIILLSDGLNTQDRWYGNGSSTSTSVDKRMYDTDGSGTCANIKAAGVTLYTIQVNTGGDPTSTLLQNCASSSDKFFMLTSADQIVSTFQQIGTNLSKLRVAK